MPEKEMVRFAEGDQVFQIKLMFRVVLKGEDVMRYKSLSSVAYRADVKVPEVCPSYFRPFLRAGESRKIELIPSCF